MHYRLVRPMRRKGSSNHWFNQRIPSDVKLRAAGLKLEVPLGEETTSLTISPKADAVRLSLRTSVPSEVKARQAQVAVYLEGVWQALRVDQPVPLTHRQIVALSGEIYHGWSDDRHERPWPSVVHLPDGSWQIDPEASDGGSDQWEEAVMALQGDDIRELETALGPIVDRLLLRKGLGQVAPSSRPMLLREFRRALMEGLEVRRRQSTGDYSADPTASRFPQWEAPSQVKPPKASSGVALRGLVDDWWVEAKASGRSRSTYESYRSAFARLADFLDHNDAGSVTPTDIVRFKDHRLAQGISTKTVGDSDLAAFRSIFQWATDNLKLATNPAEKARVKRTKPIKRRSKAFTVEEARAILSHSLNHRGRERPKTQAAKRWVPWLCAYTGARLGEMVQLRKQDLRREGELWVLTITPEAGTVKNKEMREVVLHADLVEQAFPAFVKAAPGGYLFLNAVPGDDIRGVWRSIKNRITEFVREVVTDSEVAPNRGWRHLFRTTGTEVGIPGAVVDSICGWAPRSVGESYGMVTLKAKADAMAKFPKFDLKQKATSS